MAGAWTVKTHLGMRDLRILGFSFISQCDIATWSLQPSSFRIAGFLTHRLRAHIPREKWSGKSAVDFYDLGNFALFSLLKISHRNHSIFSGREIRTYLTMIGSQRILDIFKITLMSKFSNIEANIMKVHLTRHNIPVFSGLFKAIFFKVKSFLHNIHSVVLNPHNISIFTIYQVLLHSEKTMALHSSHPAFV